MKLVCKKCDEIVTQDLDVLKDEACLCEEDAKEYLPQGFYIVSKGEYNPENEGDYLLNLRDLLNLKHTTDLTRLNGCCGLDGLDGYNLLCKNGHEIGTERSDCWMPHYAIIDNGKVKMDQI